MELDTVGRRGLIWPIFPFTLVFIFFPFELGMKILLLSISIFFLVFFYLCSAWARPKNPERYIIIGFLVSIWHTFLFFLAGILGLILAFFILKLFPLLLINLRKIFPLPF